MMGSGCHIIYSKKYSPDRMTGQARTRFFFFGNEVEPPHFQQTESTVHVAIRATSLTLGKVISDVRVFCPNNKRFQAKIFAIKDSK